ncbi:Myotubularin-related protein 5 [Strongyloides ratti]|uniref:Myotubularin-related protein 5 n=1 Tax=Strongyloides ratti TaxID=34506 RepID=A0A090KRB0_STRRB|nr:Myotubularin-related protein 5 [Strongyloides ratti]CEF59914.1 Myotubularin-related protein 5 [Strongyloides ratti]
MKDTCRLADYFVIISYDELLLDYSTEDNFRGIERRFPDFDWPDVQYPSGLENFSLPFSRNYTIEKTKPTFFVCTLTDVMGNSQYACCLVTQEKLKDNKLSQILNINLSKQSTLLLKPKIYVVLSRIPNFDFFRNFLNHIYKGLCENSINIEQTIAALLSDNIVHFGKQSNLKLSLGGIDLSFRVPKSLSWPDTGKRIYTFISNLGTIHNVLEVFINVLNEKRIIFHSKSLNRLSDACFALKTLLYPFNYSYPYIPVLPKVALTVLESPTPYIVGLHSSLIEHVIDIQDYCLVNLDDGQIITDMTTSNKQIPEPYYTKLKLMLEFTWSPTLQYADDALQEAVPQLIGPKGLEIKIRACFLKFFLDILYGYRSCLQLSRFYDTPLVTFHKTAFLGIRQLDDSKFMHDLVVSPMFQRFINERGIPYRVIDLFDILLTEIQAPSKNEIINNEILLKELNCIYLKLSTHGFEELSSSYASLVTCPYFKKEVYDTIEINDDILNKEISKNLEHQKKRELYHSDYSHKELVPQKCELKIFDETKDANSRKLEVLKICLQYIFDDKLSEARKLMCTVELSLRSISTRVSLCQLLWINLQPINKATMTSQQFDLIMKLLNVALKYEGNDDEHGIAYAILYLGNIYCRKLSSGIHQFAYTCLQNHDVWKNQKFWEIAFFHDVHQQLRRFYISKEMETTVNPPDNLKYDETEFACPFSLHNCLDTWNLFEKPTAMDVMASRIKRNLKLTDIEIEKLKNEEEAIIYGQAKHYINLMTYMIVPLNISQQEKLCKNEKIIHNDNDNSEGIESTISTYSSTESIYQNKDTNESHIIKWITCMIDRICSMVNLPQSNIDKLEQDIPSFVALHIENLEQVYNESKRITTSLEMKSFEPTLLKNEVKLSDGLRIYLFNDHRFFSSSFDFKNNTFDDNLIALPADGGLFLTNYRIIFKGYSCNPLRYGEVVECCIPIMSISSEKILTEESIYNEAINSNIPPKIANKLHTGIVITSNSFNIIRIAFQESEGKEIVDRFLQKLNNIRWNIETIKSLFAYQSVIQYIIQENKNTNSKTKLNNFKHLRKNIVKGTRKIAGLEKRKPSIQSTLHSERSSSTSLTEKNFFIGRGNLPSTSVFNDSYNENGEFNSTIREQFKSYFDMADYGILYHYIKDYERLFSNNISRSFEISFFNSNYEITKSYPAFFCIPSNFSGYTISKVAKNFKSNRFPVITWKNQKGVFLARGSNITSFNVVSKIAKSSNFFSNVLNSKNRAIDTNGHVIIEGNDDDIESRHSGQSFSTLTSTSNTSSIDALFDYFHTLMKMSYCGQSDTSNATLPSYLSNTSNELISSSNQLNTSVKTVKHSKGIMGYANFTKHATNFIKMSTGKKTSSKNLLNDKVPSIINGQTIKNSQTSSPSHLNKMQYFNGDNTCTLVPFKHSFFILGERQQSKVFKLHKNFEFFSINYPTTHDVKLSFKKFLKIMTQSQNGSSNIQCTNTISSTTNLSDTLYNLHLNYLSKINDSEWLNHISNLINISSSISELINECNISIALCIEDGSDATSQISSIVQVLLDPFYRTFEGFRLLIEKEWLSLGHRFSYRLNHSASSRQSGVAPMFLLFLDVLHQLLIQFPTAFEMNDYYFSFLAYHSMSGYFPNFLLDSEFERISIEEKIPEHNLENEIYDRSIWKYIESIINDSSKFHNIVFDKTFHDVLKPFEKIENLDIWSFYQEHHINHGLQ